MKRSRRKTRPAVDQIAPWLALLLVLAVVLWFNRSVLRLNWGYLDINRQLARLSAAQTAGEPTQDIQIELANAAAWLARQPLAPAQQASAERALSVVRAAQLSGLEGDDPSAVPPTLPTAPANSSVSAQQAIIYGNNDRAAGKYTTALYWYHTAAVQQPTASPPRYWEGVTLLASGQPAAALEPLEQARALASYDSTVGPSDVLYQLAQAQAALPTAEATALEALYSEALQVNTFIDQNPAAAYYAYGRLLEDQARPTEALAAFQQAVTIDPLRYWAFVELGTLAWSAERDRARAETALNTAIDLRPNEPAAYLLLARIYRQNNDRATARELYEQVLAFAPQNADALRGLENLNSGGE